ncbi:MAG: NAD(+)/NADH kinase [bacterium]|nr:NAD(+)/NADH kinase [bacterium]
MERIGLVVNLNREGAEETTQDLIDWLKRRDVCVWVEEDVARVINRMDVGCNTTDLSKKVDLIVALGGDGTLLRVVRLLKGKDLPILGVNLGSLGFITEIKREELYGVLQNILSGQYELEERMPLEARVVRDGEEIVSFCALNDVVITSIPRVITMDVSINEEYVGTYISDGMIVATPTGSTGYSLSAGGPIVNPLTEVLILTPICPHALAIRPMVISKSEYVCIILRSSPEGTILTADGQQRYTIIKGDKILVSKASFMVKLIKSTHRSFYEVLRERLKWEGHFK